MILWCNYEELTAVQAGAEAMLAPTSQSSCAVATSSAEKADVEWLVSVLEGDLGVNTLQEQRVVQRALEAVVECLRVEMDATVLQAHPAHELAVAAYFDYAHARVVLRRAIELGEEMEALLEVLTGSEPTPELAASFQFPD